MDAQLVNELTEILDKETGIYAKLLKLSSDKTNIIVAGKVAELENIVKLEQSIFMNLGKFEVKREQLVEKLAVQIGISSEYLTITVLARHVEPSQAERLKTIQDKMLNTVNMLKDTNDKNSKLIKNSLDFINFSINLLTSVDEVNNNYGSTGQASSSKKRNLFDLKL